MARPLSGEQRAWLRELGTLVGEAPSEALKEGSAGEARAVAGGGQDKALLGGLIPGIPDIKSITSRITIKNTSGVALRIVKGSASLENKTASFAKAPPIDIGATAEASFAVTNDPPFPVPFPTGGTGGEIKYDLVGDAKKTQLFMKWERGGIAPSRLTFQTITPEDGRFTLLGENSGEDFQFDFSAKGGTQPVPPPVPVPPPGPAANVASSCLIYVNNQTGQTLKRAEAKHERGDFMMPPERTIGPNDSINFVSVETPNAKEQGCKGFVVWEIGSPATAIWRIEWDNPEGSKNTSSATLTPQSAGFSSQDVIGQGEENVPVSFTLSGGPAPVPVPPVPVPPVPVPPVPVPPVPVPPPPEPAFEPPAEAKQPTLRKSDKSADGWVEYAQMLLNFHLKTKLKEDGDFGSATHAAVLKFQKEKSLQVDGTIGNQTWAALREGAPEKPSTDGRKPHSYVEKGTEARWALESPLNNLYDSNADLLKLAVQTVGDTELDASIEATLRITAPGAKPRVVTAKLGAAKPIGNGFSHEVDVENLRKRFASVPPDAPVTDYLVEAYLPKDLGGDFYSGKVRSA